MSRLEGVTISATPLDCIRRFCFGNTSVLLGVRSRSRRPNRPQFDDGPPQRARQSDNKEISRRKIALVKVLESTR